MEKLTAILVVADRTDADRVLLDKAVRLARSAGARIHLFACDAALAGTLRHAYNTEDAEKAWHICMEDQLAYLRSLRASVQAPDLQIDVDATCDGPSREGLLRKILESAPDLVMKCPSGAHPVRRLRFDANDWRLMRTCPAALMLVRSRPWRAVPRFAALVSVAEEATLRLPEAIVHTAEYLALGCRGELDVVYSDPGQDAGQDAGERGDHAAAFERLTREHHIGPGHAHLLSGDPEDTLPEFAANRHYDALVLGALSHRKGIAAVAGSLTSKLVDALDCDFILVKREGGEQPDSSKILPEQGPEGRGSSVAWQALFGD